MKRIPVTVFEKIHNGQQLLPEKAGEFVSYLQVILVLDNRKLKRISSVRGFRLKLND